MSLSGSSGHSAGADSALIRFGGNSGEEGSPRLNDLWSMRLVRYVHLAQRLLCILRHVNRPTVDELLRKALLAVRKFRQALNGSIM